MADRIDPIRNYKFRLTFDGADMGGFSEVMIGETTTDAVDYREGNEPTHMRKLSGLTKYGNITLKKGVTNGLGLWEWHKAIVAGQIAKNRKQVAIAVFDEAGEMKARFVVSEAWPIKYDPSDLSGKGNEVFIELLELVNEGIERAQ